MADEKKISVPDIGGAKDVDVIELLVKAGDEIQIDTPLITLESDKASMEIPSPIAGIVSTVAVKIGDKVSEGDLIVTVTSKEAASEIPEKEKPEGPSKSTTKETPESPKSEPAPPVKEEKPTPQPVAEPAPTTPSDATTISAGPAVRRLAYELGVDLHDLKGTGRKSRIVKDDVTQYVKNKLTEKPSAGGLVISAGPVIDFSQFGPIEIKSLNKIKRLTAINVQRASVTIPHVTQFDEADITDLEAFRKSQLEDKANSGVKLTILAFVCKVVCKALAVYPQFNASLDASGENLIYKQYFNLGIAVETPNGLVVPVIKGIDHLSVGEIAKEMARLSSKARDKGLMPTDMNGGCFTISSLGGIGGTAFTPIVNSPEVAILGLSRARMAPVFQSGEFKPRLMLPLSLSYDHRVIDGAEAARFTRFLSDALGDIRRILL